MIRKKTRNNHERYFHGYCDIISVYQYVVSVLIDIEHDSKIIVTFKWITRRYSMICEIDRTSDWQKTWEVIWLIRFCEQMSCVQYTRWETQRTFFWWWGISERSSINFERSSMIENVAWRWFEDNVFENLICWSYIFAKYIYSYRDMWPTFPATWRSLWRIIWIVLYEQRITI